MKLIANIVGIAAVVLCVLCYQCKTRRRIIFFNATSRVLYVLQYILLGAFEGALLDIVALLVSLLAQRKDCGWMKAHPRLTVAGANIFVVAMGMTLYKNLFSLLPIIGVLLETGAFWLNKESQIRFVSFFSAPFWLAYNLVFAAYGSAIGNILMMVSIGLAIARYDILKKV